MLCLALPQKATPEPRSAASSERLGATQQRAPDSPKIHLNVDWAVPKMGEAEFQGSLGRATSVIQFDDISAMAALRLRAEMGKAQQGTMNSSGSSVQGVFHTSLRSPNSVSRSKFLHSQTGTGVQSKLVRRQESLLGDMVP